MLPGYVPEGEADAVDANGSRKSLLSWCQKVPVLFVDSDDVSASAGPGSNVEIRLRGKNFGVRGMVDFTGTNAPTNVSVSNWADTEIILRADIAEEGQVRISVDAIQEVPTPEGGAVEIARSSVGVFQLTMSGTQGLSVGQLHTCVINGAGLVSCFGHNDFGQVGNVIGGSVAVPTTVLGLSNVVDVSAGFASSCAAQDDGLAFCWGANEAGRLGDGTTTDSAVPVQVKGLTDIAEIDAGWARFGCARASGGQVYCWGDDTWSNLGTGTCDSLCQPGTDSWNQSTQAFADCNFCLINNHPQQHEAVPVTGLSDAQKIAVGEDHACAIRVGGQVVCWGNNTGGQLGTRGPEPWRLLRSDAPQPVCLEWQEPAIGENLGQCLQTFDDAVEIYAADTMTCAIQAGGQLYCWGSQSAVVGLFGTDHGGPNPVLMSGLGNVTAQTFYETLACAVRSTGALDCWGFGAVGTGGYLTQLDSPTNIPEFDDARAVGVGKGHTCALNGESLLCWGSYGGNSVASETPTLVAF